MSEQQRPGTPRWVKISGIIAAAAIVVLVILLLVQGGHGPSRHTGGLAPAPRVIVAGPPAW